MEKGTEPIFKISALSTKPQLPVVAITVIYVPLDSCRWLGDALPTGLSLTPPQGIPPS